MMSFWTDSSRLVTSRQLWSCLVKLWEWASSEFLFGFSAVGKGCKTPISAKEDRDCKTGVFRCASITLAGRIDFVLFPHISSYLVTFRHSSSYLVRNVYSLIFHVDSHLRLAFGAMMQSASPFKLRVSKHCMWKFLFFLFILVYYLLDRFPNCTHEWHPRPNLSNLHTYLLAPLGNLMRKN